MQGSCHIGGFEVYITSKGMFSSKNPSDKIATTENVSQESLRQGVHQSTQEPKALVSSYSTIANKRLGVYMNLARL